MNGTRLRWTVWAAAVALIVVMWGVLAPADNPYDDAFITYRYADNWRRGLGLVYNPGEWVLGTTTPLFALLLGFLGRFIPDLALLGHALGVMGWALTAAAAVWLFRELPSARLAAPLFIALHPALLDSLGMEATLVTAMMVLSAAAWRDDRPRLAAVALAALILLRQDGALWALALGLEQWRRTRRLPWPTGVATLVLTLPWFAYAFWRYGDILPNSAAAKIGQNSAMAVGNGGAGQFLLDFWQALTAGSVPAGILWAALLLAAAPALRRMPEWRWLAAWLLAYLGIYTGLGVVSFPWYFVPPIVAAALLAGLGAAELAAVAARAGFRGRRAGRWAAALAAGALAGSMALSLAGHITDPRPRFRPAYQPIGAWLRANAPPAATVAAIEIGAIGYYGERPIVDTMGLVTPALTVRQFGWTETLVYAVNAFAPDYAVVLPGTAWDGVVTQRWFADWYAPAATFDGATLYARGARPAPGYQVRPAAALRDGLRLETVGAAAQPLDGREALPLRLALHATADRSAAGPLDVFLADSQTLARYAATALWPFDGGYPLALWRAGDRFDVPVTLTLPADLPDGAYRIGVADGDVTVYAGYLRHGSPPTPAAAADGAAAGGPPLFTWQGGVQLLALDVTTEAERLTVRSVWRVDAPVPRSWTGFWHLVDSDGRIVAQRDELPLGGRWPLPAWPVGTPVVDVKTIALPPDLPAGAYGLRLGWYDGAARLSAADDATSDSYLVRDVWVAEE